MKKIKDEIHPDQSTISKDLYKHVNGGLSIDKREIVDAMKKGKQKPFPKKDLGKQGTLME